jgi:hypothetical protein
VNIRRYIFAIPQTLPSGFSSTRTSISEADMSKGRTEGADDWERDVSNLTRAAFRRYQREQ